ncbi:Alpha-1,2-mannosidase [[Actinomadura] parvosata subsp. kistnae]|uniref:GH92 family glycosyl hydrolase n=1 Tax=[Actinomadura] parvosata TaxID=1955412 RepID=UPI0009ADAD9D|nr:GH92 family glycosyl hydrolase [Nonomuraea sp. ATCC 55076]SPL94264.1 Alpha-1,2-mannosidase [Actinomadura parvosata subsp. kistnae]
MFSPRSWLAAAITGALVGTVVAVPATAATSTFVPAKVKDPVAYVDPLIGSAGGGNTYPGAVRPFGMISWSPTNTAGDQTNAAGANGYSYNTPRVRGFALTHVNGAGCHPGAAGDVPIMPFAGEVVSSPTADTTDAVYASTFSHDNERAEPGRYTVTLDSGVKADLSVTTRAGVGEFTFPQGKQAHLLFRVSNSLNGSEDAEITIDPATRTVTGSVLTGAFCGRRANGGVNNRKSYYRLHFAATFDRAFSGTGTWVNSELREGTTTASGGEGYATGADRAGRGSGGYVSFDTTTDADVRMKVGISYTSLDAARQNLAKELSRRADVASVAADARRSWNEALRSIEVAGGSADELTTFYTAMYHAYLQPNVTSDVAGTYLGSDRKVHRLARGQQVQYGNFSGWDQYRAHTQLLALLEPEVAGDYAQSLYNLARQNGGVWDRWVHVNGPTHVMTGDPSAPALAGFYAFGVRNFDVRGAFDSLYRQATVPHESGLSDKGCPGQCEGQRPNLAEYLRLRYAPQDTCHCWGGAAETLEGATADFALADWAGRIGRDKERARLLPRASWWRNTFNPSAGAEGGYQQARKADGSWLWPFSPTSDAGFAQGTSATYTWMVQHDVSGLAAAMGGKDRAAERLDAFFHRPDGSWATGGDGFRYDPTNEPGIHVPWLYNALGRPWKTQETVRAMASLVYRTGPSGLPGNDDLGTMSAWYVFAALGMYPQTPSRAELLLSSPMFPKAWIRRGNGRTITVTAPQAAPGAIYVQDVRVDGRKHTRSWLPESLVDRGGEVVVNVGATANRQWATAEADLPVDHVPAAQTPVPNLPEACEPTGAACAQKLQYDVDGVATADAKAQGDLDGKGWSFPAEQLPAPGPYEGHVIPDTKGTAGNFHSLRGQRTYLTPGRYQSLDLLVTAVNGDQQTELTITYADGTTSTAPLKVTDWAAGSPRFGEQAAITADTRYNVNGTADGRRVSIWRVSVPADPAREAVSFTSPAVPNVKVFALSTRA